MGGLFGAELGGEEEPYFMDDVQSGRILVTVGTTDRQEEAAALLQDHGALEVDRMGRPPCMRGFGTPRPVSLWARWRAAKVR